MLKISDNILESVILVDSIKVLEKLYILSINLEHNDSLEWKR